MSEVLTQKEVAKLLHHTPQSIKYLTEHKGLPVHYCTRVPRYIKSEVLDWLSSQPSEKQEGMLEK